MELGPLLEIIRARALEIVATLFGISSQATVAFIVAYFAIDPEQVGFVTGIGRGGKTLQKNFKGIF